MAYACKAFCTLEMCRILEREGFCIDVVSGGELYTAIKAEFPPERIEFNGNNKQPEEIEMAVDYGVGQLLRRLEELLIERICKEKGRRSTYFTVSPRREKYPRIHHYRKKDSKLVFL